jgi:ATP-dependent protease ClpP protease subunit
VPAVTELIIAELLYLASDKKDTITMYVNSVGSSLGNQIAGAETEAFAPAEQI